MAAPRDGAPPTRKVSAPPSPHIGFLRATSPSQRRVSDNTGLSSPPQMSEKCFNDAPSTSEARPKSQSISSAGNALMASNTNSSVLKEVQKPVRTLPSWVLSYDEEDDESNPAQRLLTPPQHVQIAQHNSAPSSKHKPEPGRLYDFARERTPVTINQPAREHASRWRTFVNATAYAVVDPEAGQRVDEGWFKENMPKYERAWHTNNADENLYTEDGKPYPLTKKQKAWWWRRFHRSLLRSPIVPLVFRLTIWIFSLIALALGASIYAYSRTFGVAQRPSTLMAIIFDTVALVYILYITYDEYRGKPLGLRSPAGKMRLILLDLFFIIFNSANLSLAFDALTDVRWFCQSSPIINDSAASMNASTTGEALVDSPICQRQRALTGVLLIALMAWLVTFNISVIRLVERVTR